MHLTLEGEVQLTPARIIDDADGLPGLLGRKDE